MAVDSPIVPGDAGRRCHWFSGCAHAQSASDREQWRRICAGSFGDPKRRQSGCPLEPPGAADSVRAEGDFGNRRRRLYEVLGFGSGATSERFADLSVHAGFGALSVDRVSQFARQRDGIPDLEALGYAPLSFAFLGQTAEHGELLQILLEWPRGRSQHGLAGAHDLGCENSTA